MSALEKLRAMMDEAPSETLDAIIEVLKAERIIVYDVTFEADARKLERNGMWHVERGSISRHSRHDTFGGAVRAAKELATR